MRRKLAAGNWKMNGTGAVLDQLASLATAHNTTDIDILICPPTSLLHRAAEATNGTTIKVGGQDCHTAASGAHTGDTSADMLVEAGAAAVILGHSERRQDHHESNKMVHAKTEAALAAGLMAVVCIGETLAEREAGETLHVVGGQLTESLPDRSDGTNTVVAYEPVWAIGTGKVPTLDQINEVHDYLRAQLVTRFGEETGAAFRLLYGGSVKPGNAAEIFAVSNVDGALVGGASLKAADFSPIIKALETA